MRTPPSSRSGPRPFVPALEQFEDRCLPSCTVHLQGDILTIRGDDTAHSVRIVDNGTAAAGNVTVRCDGRTVVPRGAVRDIVVRTGAGNDRIDYRLTGNLGAGVQRIVDVNPGNGRNNFTFELTGALLPRSSLAIRANGGNGPDRITGTVRESVQGLASLLVDLHGGGGNDRVNVDATGSAVAFASVLVIDASGGGGNEQVGVTYTGLDEGVILVRAHGGGRRDHVAADLTVTNVASKIRGVLQANVTGGPGNDDLRLTIHRTDPRSPLLLNPEINGGPGKDVCAHTLGVRVVNCKKDVLLP